MNRKQVKSRQVNQRKPGRKLSNSENTNLLNDIYQRLYSCFGPQGWWPAQTSFEIILGAILTQNTAWSNVVKALNSLKDEKMLSITGIRKIRVKRLAQLIRPAGYYNLKAQRIKNFIIFLFDEYSGNLQRMLKKELPLLRHELLNINGIGPETADSILLYAAGKPIFVVDAYTRRVLSRHDLIDEASAYNQIQAYFMDHLKHDTICFNEYHALIVQLAKSFCRNKPDCQKCPLKGI